MTINVGDYISVSDKLLSFSDGIFDGVVILPNNFVEANLSDDLKHVSEASTIKTLFRNEKIPVSEIKRKDQPDNYIDNNSIEWVGPTLFYSAACLSQNPDIVSVSLGVIANYLTSIFIGTNDKSIVKLDIVVEKSKSKTCKKLSFEGSSSDLKNMASIVKDVFNEK